jgi:hypothetical protein
MGLLIFLICIYAYEYIALEQIYKLNYIWRRS